MKKKGKLNTRATMTKFSAKKEKKTT